MKLRGGRPELHVLAVIAVDRVQLKAHSLGKPEVAI